MTQNSNYKRIIETKEKSKEKKNQEIDKRISKERDHYYKILQEILKLIKE